MEHGVVILRRRAVFAKISRRNETRKDIGALTARLSNASRRKMFAAERGAVSTLYQMFNR
jgi:hypothetical protein